MSASEEKLIQAVRAYKSECENPVKDYVMVRIKRDEMFAVFAEIVRGVDA